MVAHEQSVLGLCITQTVGQSKDLVSSLGGFDKEITMKKLAN